MSSCSWIRATPTHSCLLADVSPVFSPLRQETLGVVRAADAHLQGSKPKLCLALRHSHVGIYLTQHCLTGSSKGRPGTIRGVQTMALFGGAKKGPKGVAELDNFIDELRSADYMELPQIVAENVLSFDQSFWLRLATRVDTAGSVGDAQEIQELASTVMGLVDAMVRKTEEKIESATDIIKSILSKAADEFGEFRWPLKQEALKQMKAAVVERAKAGFLDESFLSAVSAQMRQARDDGDKPGLIALLQKILQLWAAHWLSRKSYAQKKGRADEAESLLERVMASEEEDWDTLLGEGLVFGGASVREDKFFKVVEKRVERVLMRTESGSYTQRILVEYIREIEARGRSIIDASRAPPPTIQT